MDEKKLKNNYILIINILEIVAVISTIFAKCLFRNILVEALKYPVF